MGVRIRCEHAGGKAIKATAPCRGALHARQVHFVDPAQLHYSMAVVAIFMTFHEWHGPVPVAHDLGVFDRALQFLMRLQYGKPVRRLNWTMTVNPRLDTSPEIYPIWGPDRTTITPQNVGDKLHLRVELQTLFRLPRSNAILFGVRAYLASISELARVPKWGRRLHRVLRDLHPEIAEYKGTTRFRQIAVDYLAGFDDGKPTSPGIAADGDLR